MLVGIRNILIINTVVALFCVLNFYLPLSADGWVEIRTALVITAALFAFNAVLLVFRFWIIWHFARVMCYASALVLVLYFISLVGKGYLFSLPIYTLLFIVFGFYFIGVRGYLNSDSVRAAFGIQAGTN
ncbi:hypothetical protein MNBD_GAMMA22-839 [hydrothermal vent metagenome]|uniref:Uncharacterized protein n=1 Tax=hydrothermal vent metagenome TaxID=652676 RepID=A0A3B1ATJ0_9ZZZZ